MKSQRLIAVAVLVTVGVSAAYFLWSKTPPSSQAENPAPEISGPAPSEQPDVATPQSLAASDGNRLRTDFESAPDLRTFMDSLKAAADAGDPEAMWWTYRTWDYCKSYASNPANFSRDTQTLTEGVPSNVSIGLKTHRGKVEARCRGFSGGKTPASTDLDAMVLAAAKAGNLAAEASSISKRINTTAPDDYVKDLVSRVRSSNDPEAYLAISDAMGIGASSRPDLFGTVSGTNYSTFAWQLAACGKGLDCSATGSLMTMYCSNGGVCGQFNDFRDMVFNGLVPQSEANRVNALISKISD